MNKSFIFLLACTSLSFRNYSSGVVAASEPDTLEVQWSYSIGCEDRGGGRQLGLMVRSMPAAIQESYMQSILTEPNDGRGFFRYRYLKKRLLIYG